jgi:UDP-N-acetylmuramoyl-tripeptide--D-alanyl-D-alanine ligase
VTWQLDAVVCATGAEVWRRGAAAAFSSVATDTRVLAGGELFVALRGPRYDAHRFAAEAAAAGARGLLVERAVEVDGRSDLTILVVRDTLRALQDLAAARRQALAPCVLAVTGSNGKTTTKEMLAAILAAAGGAASVLKTTLNLNNLIGVPLTLLRLTGRERHAVVEMGMNAPGEIWRLAEIADPDVGVITNVGPAHLAGVGSLEGVARAKGELFARMRRDAVAVANADDPRVAALAGAFPGRVVRFGAGAEIAAEAVRTGAGGAPAFRLHVGTATAEVALRVPGRHNVTNALAAAAAAHAVGVGIDAIAAGLASAEAVGNRMRVVALPSGITILNDSYNANPASVAAALQSLAESAVGRRIAVLGDMLELGAASAEHHRAVGRLATALGIDALHLFGEYAEETAAGAGGSGMPAAAIHVASSHAAIADAIVRAAGAGDWVLVKGSRGQRMEEVVRLLGAPE